MQQQENPTQNTVNTTKIIHKLITKSRLFGFTTDTYTASEKIKLLITSQTRDITIRQQLLLLLSLLTTGELC